VDEAIERAGGIAAAYASCELEISALEEEMRRACAEQNIDPKIMEYWLTAANRGYPMEMSREVSRLNAMQLAKEMEFSQYTRDALIELKGLDPESPEAQKLAVDMQAKAELHAHDLAWFAEQGLAKSAEMQAAQKLFLESPGPVKFGKYCTTQVREATRAMISRITIRVPGQGLHEISDEVASAVRVAGGCARACAPCSFSTRRRV
jgi:hypothetical protein